MATKNEPPEPQDRIKVFINKLRVHCEDLVKLFNSGEEKLFEDFLVPRPTERDQFLSAIEYALKNGSTIIIYGDAGCGKSVFVKQMTHDRSIREAVLEDNHNIREISLMDSVKPSRKGLSLAPELDFEKFSHAIRDILITFLSKTQRISEQQLKEFSQLDNNGQHAALLRLIRKKEAKYRPLILFVDEVDHFSNETQVSVLQELIPFMTSPNIVLVVTARPQVAHRLRTSPDARITYSIQDYIRINYLGSKNLLEKRFESFPEVRICEDSVFRFLDGLSGTDARVLFGIFRDVMSRIALNRGKGGPITLSTDLLKNTVFDQPESGGGVYNLYENLGKQGEPLLLFLCQHVINHNQFDDEFFRRMKKKLGVKTKVLKGLIEKLVNWGMISEYFFAKTPNEEFVLTERGRFYALELARSPFYQQRFSGKFSALSETVSKREMVENGILEFLLNDLEENSGLVLGELYERFRKSTHCTEISDCPYDQFISILKKLSLVNATDHKYSRKGTVTMRSERIKRVAEIRGIYSLPWHLGKKAVYDGE